MIKPNRKTFKLQFAAKSIWVWLLLSVSIVNAQTKRIWIEINPSAKCGNSDVCYKIMNFPGEGAAFDEIKSDFFYAVILKTTPKCGATKMERLKVQALFPKNKVFTSAINCDEEDNAFYEGINENEHGFVAVYAGKTKPEAEKFLQIVAATNKFSGANLRKTRFILNGT